MSPSATETKHLKKHPLEITGAQRRRLRGLGHHLKPLLQIGRNGVTDAVVLATSELLEQHELIKVSTLPDGPLNRKEAPRALAEKTGSHLAQIIGRVAILYRQRAEDPEIELP